MAAEERFDPVLLELAGQCGGIQPLLKAFFSFLYRKTDFFHVMQPGDQMGFPDGVAQKILLQAFKTYEHAAKQQQAKRPPPPPKAADIAPSAAASVPKPSPVAEPAAEAAPLPAASAPAATAATSAPKGSAGECGSTDAPTPGSQAPPPTAAVVPAAPGQRSVTTEAEVMQATKAMPHLAERADVPYNGGRTERYSWEQTLNDVTIQVPVPEGTRAKDVICVIGKKKLTLKLRGGHELIDGIYPCDARNGKEIWEQVRCDESYWNLGESQAAGGGVKQLLVCIYLEKERECWWKSALHGDCEIDTTQVDSTRSMYDYDPETQGAIRKIMFDQDQKRKGLPTSEELKNEDMLRKAWDAEGSPFKGQPFDPSLINFKGEGDGPGVPGMPPMPTVQ